MTRIWLNYSLLRSPGASIPQKPIMHFPLFHHFPLQLLPPKCRFHTSKFLMTLHLEIRPIFAKTIHFPLFRRIFLLPPDFGKFTCFLIPYVFFVSLLLWPWWIYTSHNARTGRPCRSQDQIQSFSSQERTVTGLGDSHAWRSPKNTTQQFGEVCRLLHTDNYLRYMTYFNYPPNTSRVYVADGLEKNKWQLNLIIRHIQHWVWHNWAAVKIHFAICGNARGSCFHDYGFTITIRGLVTKAYNCIHTGFTIKHRCRSN